MAVPQNPEFAVFRDVRGPKAEVAAKVAASNTPAEVKSFLAWAINSRAGAGVILDCHLYSAHAGELVGHLAIRKLY